MIRLTSNGGKSISISYDFKNNALVVPVLRQIHYKIQEGDYYISSRDHIARIMQLAKQANIEVTMDKELSEWWGKQQVDLELAAKLASLPEIQLNARLKKELWKFQRVGSKFLALKERAILADQPGMGKTAQVIAAAMELITLGKIKRVLVICPTSAKYNWGGRKGREGEIQKWTNASVTVIDGNPDKRTRQYAEAEMTDFTVISWDLLRVHQRRDIVAPQQKRVRWIPSRALEIIRLIGFDLIIADEITHGMNYRNQRRKGVIMLLKNTKHVFGLTGAPLMNNLRELFVTTALIDSHLFPGWLAFKKEYLDECGAPVQAKLPKLQERMKRIMIRRTKEEVAKELPELVHAHRYAELLPPQKKLYDKALSEIKDFVSKSIEDGTDVTVIIKQAIARLTKMKQICCHPYLVAPDKVNDTYGSAKLDMLKAVMEEISRGDKVIVFTQFAKMAKIIHKRFTLDYEPLMITGSMNALERDKSQHDFQNKETHRMLIVTTAEGIGMNLTAANYVVLFDQPWNPSMMDQAIERAHRIGQIKPVTAIWLWTENTIEQAIWRTLTRKKDLFKAVVDGEGITPEEFATSKIILEDVQSWINEPTQ